MCEPQSIWHNHWPSQIFQLFAAPKICTLLDTNQNCVVFFILVCILLFSTLAQDKIYIIFHQDIIHSYICMYII